jgi:ArsR family transcriptional regulator, arsenate/arsenite/antimonite-responsive transcriptional repressor
MQAVEDFVRVSKALSDPTRIRILSCLSVRELCVCELVELLDQGQPTISRHLGILQDAGLVEDTRDGKYVSYRLRRPARTGFAQAVLRGLLLSHHQDPDLKALEKRALIVSRESIG